MIAHFYKYILNGMVSLVLLGCEFGSMIHQTRSSQSNEMQLPSHTGLLDSLQTQYPVQRYIIYTDSLSRQPTPTGNTIFVDSLITQSTPIESTIYTDSMTTLPAPQASSPILNIYLWLSIPFIGGLCTLFLIKRRKLKKQIYSLNKDKQITEEKFLQEIDAINKNHNQLFAKYIIDTPIYIEIKQLIKYNKDRICNQELLSDTKWEELFSTINVATHNMTMRLRQEHPNLKAEDIRFFCLIKSGFTHFDIACIMGRTSNMMYKRRRIIAERIGLKEDSKDLIEYIKNY